MNLLQIPIIGALLAQGQTKIAQGVQDIKEKIAVFHLTPRRIGNFKARMDQLSRIPAVGTNTDDVAKILSARQKVAALSDNYDSANRQLDIAMGEVQRIQAGDVSLAAAGQVAATISSMQSVLSQVATIDNLLTEIEKRVLTPQQYAQVNQIGTFVPQASGSLGALFTPRNLGIGLAIGGAIYLMRRRRRGR